MLPFFPELTGPELEIQKATRAYVDQFVRKTAIDDDQKARFNRNHFNEFAKKRWTSLAIPRQYGGAGQSSLSYFIFLEEVARASVALAVACSVPNLVQGAIAQFGTDEQREKYLNPMLSGEFLGAFSLSEPGAGSDAASLRLSAQKTEGGYLLNGSKIWCSNGNEADIFLVMARTSESRAQGVTSFLVRAKTSGFRPGKEEHKMGLRASSLVELIFENCFVPESQRLALEGEGLKVALSQLDSGRISIAAASLGLAVEVLERGLRALYRRKSQGDNTEWEEQRLAEHYAQSQAVRALLRTTAELRDAKVPFTIPASQVKLLASDLAMAAASDAVHFAGLEGGLENSEIERYFRDAKALQIVEGTNQIQRKVLARRIEEAMA